MKHILGFAIALATTTGCTLLPHRTTDKATPADEGELGPLHAAHPDQIVFAAADIPRNGQVDVALATELRADQAIWTRVFLTRPIQKTITSLPDPDHNCKWDNRRQLDVYARIDGGDHVLLNSSMPADKTWFSNRSMMLGTKAAPLVADEAILPNQARELEARALVMLASLPDGTHSLALEMEASCSAQPRAVVAAGTVKVVVDAASRAALAKRIRLAAQPMRDAAEIARLTKAAAGTFDGATLLDFRVMDTTWELERSPEGNPISRHVLAVTYYRKGAICTLVGSNVVEQHEGGGHYGAPVFYNVDTDARLAAHAVPCGIDTTR